MKIKAAVVKEVGAPFEIKDDVELHDVGPTDLQIHMVASGICHSDEAIRRGDASLGYPVILGHEGLNCRQGRKRSQKLQAGRSRDFVVLL